MKTDFLTLQRIPFYSSCTLHDPDSLSGEMIRILLSTLTFHLWVLQEPGPECQPEPGFLESQSCTHILSLTPTPVHNGPCMGNRWACLES